MTQLTETAILLVAGVGSRLRPLTDSIPKALVSVGESSILERAVNALKLAGVRHFVFATGYRQEAVVEKAREWKLDAVFCPNERYEATQNSISLLRCESALRGKSFFKLDGDVLFETEILQRLLRSAEDLAVAVDGKRALDEEAMKVQVDAQGRISRFGKAIAVRDAQGESIGIERLSARAGAQVFDAIARLEERGICDKYYEDVYADLIEEGKISARAIEVGDLRWTEVDSQADLAHAKALFQRS
ncbi:MAG: phosphocholine cytidylyltransferase family protein [Polyangiaceae bacterium]